MAPLSDGSGANQPHPRDLLAQRGYAIDTLLAPIVFVAVNAAAGLRPAAAAAVGLALVVLVVRLVRREAALNAVGGVLGVVIAALIALRSGGAEGYFVPKAISNALFALAFAGSAVVGRPAVGLVFAAFYRYDMGWLRDRRVRRAYAEATWAWVGLFLLRAALYVVLIQAGKVGLLAVTSLLLGLPAFAALLVGTYAFVPRRLRRLGAPDPPAAPAPA